MKSLKRSAEKPSIERVSWQDADDSLVLRRLTDVSLYGASHRRRFEMSKKRRRSNKETKFDRKNDVKIWLSTFVLCIFSPVCNTVHCRQGTYIITPCTLEHNVTRGKPEVAHFSFISRIYYSSRNTVFTPRSCGLKSKNVSLKSSFIHDNDGEKSARYDIWFYLLSPSI